MMLHGGLQRYLLLSRRPDGEFYVSEDSEGAAWLGVVAAGLRVAVNDDGHVVLLNSNRDALTLDDASRDRMAGIFEGYTLQSQAAWFQVAVSNVTWGRLLPTLAINGEEMEHWKMEFDAHEIRLLGPSGRRGSVQDGRWWKVIDPNFSEAFAVQLLEGAGVERRYRPRGE